MRKSIPAVAALTLALAAGTIATAHADDHATLNVTPGGCGLVDGENTSFVMVQAVHPGEFTVYVNGDRVHTGADLHHRSWPAGPGTVEVRLVPADGDPVTATTDVPACTTPTPTPTGTPEPSAAPTPGTTPTPGQATPTPTPTTPGPTGTPTAAATATTTAPADQPPAQKDTRGGLAKTGK